MILSSWYDTEESEGNPSIRIGQVNLRSFKIPMIADYRDGRVLHTKQRYPILLFVVIAVLLIAVFLIVRSSTGTVISPIPNGSDQSPTIPVRSMPKKSPEELRAMIEG